MISLSLTDIHPPCTTLTNNHYIVSYMREGLLQIVGRIQEQIVEETKFESLKNLYIYRQKLYNAIIIMMII